MKKIVITVVGTMLYLALVIGIKNFQQTAFVSGTEQELTTQLKEYINFNQKGPIEPRLDPVFQFVPGLEGTEIDYGLSLNNLMVNGIFDESLIIRKSIPYKGNPEEFRAYPMYKGNDAGDYVSLLINVAWGDEELEKMIEILDQTDVKATFFFEGKWAKNHQEQVKLIHEKGHLIGNHSYSHPAKWGGFSYEQYKEEIVQTNEILTAIIGEPIIYFAPPGGEFNDKTIKAAYDQGMYTILWTTDTIDWKGYKADKILDRVMSKVHSGSLILMHPKPETVIALETMINQLKDLDYEFKTVEQMVTGERPGYLK